MKNLRVYGKQPFSIAVVHGGPGASGEMAPVARALSSVGGILEPLQTANSLNGQVQELNTVIKDSSTPPIVLIGHSWGAWLSFIFTARYPLLVNKLILVGSGPYEEKYAVSITGTRLNRLSEEDRVKVVTIMETLDSPSTGDKNSLLAQLGKLALKADSYDLTRNDNEVLEYRYDIYQNVWEQASEMRNSGELLKLGESIHCSTIAIHGDYDPHPPEGVKDPLSRTLKSFRFFLLKNCGHYPWMERAAIDKFYNILKNEVEQCT